MKRKFVLQVSLTVDDMWIEDGFGCDKKHLENIQEYLRGLCGSAYEHEFKVKVKLISGPDRKTIRQLQGYEK